MRQRTAYSKRTRWWGLCRAYRAHEPRGRTGPKREPRVRSNILAGTKMARLKKHVNYEMCKAMHTASLDCTNSELVRGRPTRRCVGAESAAMGKSATRVGVKVEVGLARRGKVGEAGLAQVGLATRLWWQREAAAAAATARREAGALLPPIAEWWPRGFDD
jgi:hypothetical protein